MRVCWLGILILAGSLAAAEPALDSLVEGLGADDPQARERSYELLAKRGREALPLLRRATYHAKHEVRFRAEQLLAELAPSEVWNEESRKKLREANVTLRLKDQPLPEALQALAAQAGLPLLISPHVEALLKAEPRRANLDVTGYGAELALRRILADAKLSYSLVFNAVVVEAGGGSQAALQRGVLDTKVGPLAFANRPLREALQEVHGALGAGLAFDPEVFKRADIQKATVTLSTQRPLRLEGVLSMLLEGYDLGYAFDERRLFISSRARVQNERLARTYELQGLLNSLLKRRGDTAQQLLAEALRESLDPLSWDQGAALNWKADGELVVTQGLATHARIEAYLKLLQKVEGTLNELSGEYMEF